MNGSLLYLVVFISFNWLLLVCVGGLHSFTEWQLVNLFVGFLCFLVGFVCFGLGAFFWGGILF
jgi:hypothetical protein